MSSGQLKCEVAQLGQITFETNSNQQRQRIQLG